MKLAANRAQDPADVVRVLQAGVSEQDVAAYLSDHAPDLLSRLAELLG